MTMGCMRMSPRVSIGMPVYNGEDFIREAVDSILGQTFTDLELVISDNGSTDQTEAICRDYAEGDKRVRYYRSEINRGAAWNYNRVFALSSAEYFKWAAADDVCAPDMLQQYVDVLDRNRQAIVCYCETKIIDERGSVVRDYEDHMNLELPRARDRFDQMMRYLGECNAVFGLVRSRVMKRTPLIGSFLGSDVCLLVELSLYGQVVKIPEYLFFRRVHPEASSCKSGVIKQMEFFNPAKKPGIALPTWRKIVENFRSIARTPTPVAEKCFLFWHLLRLMLQARSRYTAELGAAVRDIVCK